MLSSTSETVRREKPVTGVAVVGIKQERNDRNTRLTYSIIMFLHLKQPEKATIFLGFLFNWLCLAFWCSLALAGAG